MNLAEHQTEFSLYDSVALSTHIQHEKTLVNFTNGEIGFFVTKSSSGGCKSDISHPFLSPLCAPPPSKSLKQWRVAVKERKDTEQQAKIYILMLFSCFSLLHRSVAVVFSLSSS